MVKKGLLYGVMGGLMAFVGGIVLALLLHCDEYTLWYLPVNCGLITATAIAIGYVFWAEFQQYHKQNPP